jgi:hypothetical protein
MICAIVVELCYPLIHGAELYGTPCSFSTRECDIDQRKYNKFKGDLRRVSVCAKTSIVTQLRTQQILHSNAAF